MKMLMVCCVCVFFLSCGQEPGPCPQEQTASTNSHTQPQAGTDLGGEQRQQALDELQYYVFGTYCGKCSGECATMYRYNMTGNANTLLIDHTDSYFRGPQLVFATPGTSRQLQQAGTVIRHIPLEFLLAGSDKTYGCPDCTDGCGIYFEWGNGRTVRKFHIDPHDEQIDPHIRRFVRYLQDLNMQ